MATIETTVKVTLDEDEAAAVRQALHSNRIRHVLDEIRAALSEPLTVAGKRGAFTQQLRPGAAVTEEMIAALRTALAQRRARLAELLAGIDGKSPTAEQLVADHDAADRVLAAAGEKVREANTHQPAA